MNSKAGKAIIVSLYTFALYFLVYQFLGAFLVAHFGGIFSATAMMLIAQIVTIPFIIYPLIRTPKPSGEKKCKAWEGALWVILMPVLGFILNIVLAMIPMLLQDEAYQNAYSALTEGGILPVLILSGVVAPVLEEFVFRGVVFSQFCNGINPAVGIIVSSLLFGFIHFNLPQFIYGTVMGAALAFSYYRTKRLLVPVLAHSLSNTLISLLGMLVIK